MRRISPPKNLRYLFLRRRMSAVKIARRLGVCHSVVYRWLEERGWKSRFRVKIDKEKIISLYLNNKQSMRFIADQLKISVSSVKKALRGIPKRRLPPGTFQNRLDLCLNRNYGISLEQYKKLLKSQRGLCKICGKPPAKTGRTTNRLHIDHKGNQVRGLLCGNCNTGLGLFKDDILLLRSAIYYLQSQEIKK